MGVVSGDGVCMMSLSSVSISEGVVVADVQPEPRCQRLLPKAMRIQTGRVNERRTRRLTRSRSREASREASRRSGRKVKGTGGDR